jgi:hypothetical protein
MKRINPILAYLLPRLRDFIFLGIFYSVILTGPQLFNGDGDLGWHTTIGNYILHSWKVPTTDIFSHTLYGARFVAHEWLAEVAFAFANQLMGLNGDVLLTALLASITILLVYEQMVKRNVFRLVALFISLWVAFAASIHWLARPHMFTFLFVAIWTYWLEDIYTYHGKNIWHFPLLMFIWANTHGAFFAGFVVWGTYVADWIFEFWQVRGTKEMGRQLALIGLLSFLVTFVNPSGWHLWDTTVGFVSNSFLTSHIVEYASPDFHDKNVWPFLFMVGFALFALVQAGRKIQVREALLLAGWAVLGLYSIRNIPLFAVITAPTFGKLIQPWAEKISALVKWDSNLGGTEKALRGNVWIIGSTVLLGLILWSGTPLDKNGIGNIYLPNKMPIQAVDWLQANPQEGKMFNNYVWGGYILYRLWPAQTVFIDARTDFYGEKLLREYLTVNNVSDGWKEILEKYNVSWMIVQKGDRLAEYLKANQTEGWKVIYEDELAVIFRKDSLAYLRTP